MVDLYITDQYKREFEASVLIVDGKKIFLDETYFFPIQGGQLNDTGKIYARGEEYDVVNVFKENGKVYHEVDREGINVGDKVKCTIDWNRRYTFMKYHTASHILCRVIFNETNAKITGSQIYIDKTRNDFNIEKFDKGNLRDYEEKANEIIRQGKEVLSRVLSKEEAFKIPGLVRTEEILIPEDSDEIRIVEIEDVDIQACCGTHVKNTREIKGIKIIKAENKGKSNRRIYFRLVE